MPNSFEDRMIEAVERGETTPMEAYEYVRDVALDQADLQRKAAKENLQPLTRECHRGDHANCRSHEKGGTHECQCACHR